MAGKRTAAAIACTLFGVLLGSGPAAAQKPAPRPANDDCLACHGDPGLTREVNGQPVSLYVNPEKFKNSTHGGMFRCVDCHTDVQTLPHQARPAKLSCATCHGDQQAGYDRSAHAQAKRNGDQGEATCVDCHGSPHELLPASDSKSKVNHANIPATCGGCHSRKPVMAASGHSTQLYISYQQSVHGRAVAQGVEKAAVCTDCHGTHEILGAADPKSSTFKFRVPATCGKCHAPVEKEFNRSIHGQAVARGEGQAPVCTDCHGTHSIQSHKDSDSPVAAQNLSEATCARCHEGVRLSREFGFEGNRVTTYLASYHGLASHRGSAVVANCASCHGVHNILPSSNPYSTINPANLLQTCGQCHVGLTKNFVVARVHVNAPLASDAGSVAVTWVRQFYLALIVLVVGGMLIHNIVIWRFKALARRRHHGPAMVTRMTLSQRLQHAVLLVSFTILVLTGFALKYPDSWFGYLALGMSEHLRGMVHRIAGAVLIGVCTYHLFYVAIARDGRRMLRDIWLRFRDATDFWGNLLYHLGLNSQKPGFGRFTYAEKVEYWALVWGTVVMAVTGIMLWAKVMVGNHLPRWWLDVATAVHLYEAVLATLAIVIWHFYQVFLDPDTYPMSWAWWDGQVPVEHHRTEHPLDLETVPSARRPSEELDPSAEAVAKGRASLPENSPEDRENGV